MADIRCTNCGKDNPDFLDVCQFCQNPLKPEAILHFGEKPTKKNTGELEGVLPDWLKSARQQSRDSAEEDAVQAAAQPKSKKEEPLDLLAGLAFQAEASDEEEIPDWLSSINPTPKSQPAAAAARAEPEPESDFFAQFNQAQPSQVEPLKPTSASTPAPTSDERDELSAWFTQPTEETPQAFTPEQDSAQDHTDWGVGEQSSAPKEEEDLSWLRNLEAVAKQTDELKAPKTAPNWERELSTPSQSAEQEDLSWLNNLGAIPLADEPAAAPSHLQDEKEDLSWLNSLGGTSTPGESDSSKEEPSWLNNLGGTIIEQPSSQPSSSKEDLSWLDSFAASPETTQSAASPSSDNPDWLNKLGAPAFEESAAPTSQDELNWQGVTGLPAEPASSAFSEPSSQDDLSWLNNFGETPVEPPSKPREDLGWLNEFGQAAEASQPTPPQPAAQEDLTWLNSFSQTPETPQPASPQASTQDDLSWLNSLQGEPEPLSSAPFAEPPTEESSETSDTAYVSPFVPRKTAPLASEADQSIPDWLKSATEEPSMPMNAGALDQFREDFKIPSKPDEPFSWKSFTQGTKATDEQPPQPKPEPAFVDPGLFTPPAESSIPSTEDVNSLFSMEMPDWLTQAEPSGQEETSQPIGIHAEGGEALSPVDLPSWVQAMRPMDAVISETVPSMESQPTEREGPLAGLRGVIPSVPVGSARRPKPISLKLQASDEQQTSASILEQLLAAETSPRTLASAPTLASQSTLRRILAVLFWVILGAMITMRSQLFAVPVGGNEVGSVIQTVPDNSNVLVVLDYEPALAGEMEAVSGPLLDQLTLSRHAQLSFVATSSTGPALAERLLSHTNINKTSNGGPGYVAGQDYFNLGFLPGAEAGVLSLIQSPNFSEYGAVIVLTDNASSARIWIEQLHKATQPLLIASSAQAGPLLRPYVSSGQVDGLIAGLADASRFEFVNNSRPGIARLYWDAFGVGLVMAIVLIFLGSLWSIFAGIRARRAESAEG